MPSIFAFLPNKQKDTYRTLFKFLQTLVPNLATGLFLQTFSCDYEKGLIEAARIEFDPLNQTMKIGTFGFLIKPRPRVIMAIAAIQFQYLKLWLYPETFCNTYEPLCSFS